MGGECNYLLQVNPTTYRLEFVPEAHWQTAEMLSWDEDDIQVGGGGDRIRMRNCCWCSGQESPRPSHNRCCCAAHKLEALLPRDFTLHSS